MSAKNAIKNICWFSVFALLAGCDGAEQNNSVRILTLNICFGATCTDQPLDQVVKTIQASGADIVAIQEKYRNPSETNAALLDSVADDLAAKLSWHLLEQPGSVPGAYNTGAVLSKFPAVDRPHGQFCRLISAPQREIAVCNIHAVASPYQPYQLLRIPYHDAPFLMTPDEAIAAANSARGMAVDRLIEETQSYPLDIPVVIAGDFNEPSHLDWTAEAVDSGLHPLVVEFPQSLKLQEAGFVDAFREIYADEVSDPGWTWTPTTPIDDPADHHDRIDFIYLKGVEAVSVSIVGESERFADIVVEPWPTDHRGVLVTISLRK